MGVLAKNLGEVSVKGCMGECGEHVLGITPTRINRAEIEAPFHWCGNLCIVKVGIGKRGGIRLLCRQRTEYCVEAHAPASREVAADSLGLNLGTTWRLAVRHSKIRFLYSRRRVQKVSYSRKASVVMALKVLERCLNR